MKTYVLKGKEVVPQWHVLDATARPLGRLATEVASLLRGKHRTTFTPYMDNGDFVVVVNAAKVTVSHGKEEQKKYYHHSGYIGALKTKSMRDELEKRPEWVVQHAVKGMLPSNTLGRHMLKKLKVYAGPEHPHMAQVVAAAKAAESAKPASPQEEKA